MNMKTHCCAAMTRFIDPQCEQHPNPRDCEDALVTYDPRFDSYALLPRFGASWVTAIDFCPWCGDRKRELRDRYFDELEAKGYNAPWEDIPEAYRSDAWWRDQGL